MHGETGSVEAEILIVDDEEDMIKMLHDMLQREGYRIAAARDGKQALQIIEKHCPDLVLLDLMMPDMDGWEACRRIRELTNAPIIMLTALSGDRLVARGLELGADDYLTKPFSMLELSARVRAALRRYRQPYRAGPVVQVDDYLTVNFAQRQVIAGGKTVELSAIEYKIMACFLDNADRVLTHKSLLTQVWGWEYADQTDYLKVYIHNLRKKIEKNPQHPSYILTERGLGYRFQTPTRPYRP
jgi:two-component system, OmpR family, KDP operon response regulator KdpE